ncbi:MAG: transcription elongation factor GreA [Erysipelotrichaceae bacterium]|nr:transcription elongation factor GreA [Erysipelotrichaceae bacterium]
MEEQKTIVTKEGKEELEKEYQRLLHEEREKVIDDLKAARSQGDLSENADYDAARDQQARVEARIRELEHMLNNLEIIDETKSKGKKRVVTPGSTVVLLTLDENEEETYTIVGTVQADPLNGLISNESPLAQAVINHKVNETVTVNIQHPYRVKILEIK